MDGVTLLAVISLVFVTGFLFAPLGLGGGMLFVPILHYVAGWPIDGGLLSFSLALTTVVAYGSGLAHRKAGHWSSAGRNSALKGAIPGALVGVSIVVLLGDSMDIVFKVTSVVMIAWAIQKTVKKIRDQSSSSRQDEEPIPLDTQPLILGSSIGGVLSAVLGIGAGAIYIPVLRQYAHLAARTAIGTSLGIMMFVVPVALVTHGFALSDAQLNFLVSENILVLAPLAMLATFLGAQLGARIGLKFLPTELVMGVFLGLLIFIWIRYAVDLMAKLGIF